MCIKSVMLTSENAGVCVALACAENGGRRGGGGGSGGSGGIGAGGEGGEAGNPCSAIVCREGESCVVYGEVAICECDPNPIHVRPASFVTPWNFAAAGMVRAVPVEAAVRAREAPAGENGCRAETNSAGRERNAWILASVNVTRKIPGAMRASLAVPSAAVVSPSHLPWRGGAARIRVRRPAISSVSRRNREPGGFVPAPPMPTAGCSAPSAPQNSTPAFLLTALPSDAGQTTRTSRGLARTATYSAPATPSITASSRKRRKAGRAFPTRIPSVRPACGMEPPRRRAAGAPWGDFGRNTPARQASAANNSSRVGASPATRMRIVGRNRCSVSKDSASPCPVGRIATAAPIPTAAPTGSASRSALASKSATPEPWALPPGPTPTAAGGRSVSSTPTTSDPPRLRKSWASV